MTYDALENQETQDRNGHGKAVFTGALLGGLAGAVTALLFAPQSGRETRTQIRNKAAEVRNLASEKVGDTVGQVRGRADQINAEMRGKARQLRQQAQDVLVEQLDRVSAAAQAGKKTVQGSNS